jgi:hypothetical protein
MGTTVSLNGYVQATDSITGTVALKRLFQSLATTGTVFVESQGASVGSSPTAITLAVSPVQFIYIKNTHANQTITVTWTPNGGSSNPVVTLEPGSAIILVEATTGAGITALTLTGSGASTTYEFVYSG